MGKDKELLKIAEEIERCNLCRKWGTGKAVPGEGNSDADIVFVGEAPGRVEADSGRPFVGRSGKFFRATLKDLGINEKEVFITSPVHYLPLSVTPSKENILHGRQHLLKQLSIIRPKIIVLMGNTACFALLDRKVSILKEHGGVLEKGGRICFITFHPAYAARFPEGKRGFVQDLRRLKKLMEASLE